MTAHDIILLNGMTREVPWTDIDRWEYSVFLSTGDPQPPHYSIYTGLGLGNTFVAFIVLNVIQFITVTIVKILSVQSIKRDNWFNVFVHILENLNIPFPYKDWDTENLTLAEYFLDTC